MNEGHKTYDITRTHPAARPDRSKHDVWKSATSCRSGTESLITMEQALNETYIAATAWNLKAGVPRKRQKEKRFISVLSSSSVGNHFWHKSQSQVTKYDLPTPKKRFSKIRFFPCYKSSRKLSASLCLYDVGNFEVLLSSIICLYSSLNGFDVSLYLIGNKK